MSQILVGSIPELVALGIESECLLVLHLAEVPAAVHEVRVLAQKGLAEIG